MSKKSEASRKFLEKIEREIPNPGAGPEAQLDYLLREYRKIRSGITNAETKLAFLEPIIISAICEISRRDGKSPEYISNTGRTMGMLVYSPQTLGSGKQAASTAMRIRFAIARILDKKYSEVRSYVRMRRTTSYSVDWDGVRSLGEDVYETVRKITGVKSRPTLIVGPVSKRAKLGKERKGR